MNKMKNEAKLNELNFEITIWITFALLAFLNIFADKLEICYIQSNSQSLKNIATGLFKVTLYSSLFIYIYFFLKAKNKLREEKIEKNKIGYLASSLFVIATLLLMYNSFQIENYINEDTI